jgi:two-component system, OmpR family, response regulator
MVYVRPPDAKYGAIRVQPNIGVALADFEGTLRDRTFFNLFYELFLKRATGHLSVKNGRRHKDIFFEQGQPVFVASNLEQERFGEFMVARGLLQRDDLNVALDSMHTDGDRLGDTCIRLGLLDPDQVFDGLREQQILRLTDLCAWDSGEFAYVDGQLYAGDKFELRLDAADLLLRAARAMPEVTLIERLDDHLTELVELSADVSLDESEFHLSAAERGVLTQLDGTRTPAEIIAGFFDNEKRRRGALLVVYLLWEAGLLQFRRRP